MKERIPLLRNKTLLIASGLCLASFLATFMLFVQKEGSVLFAAGIFVGLLISILLLSQKSRIDFSNSYENIEKHHQQLLDAVEKFEDGFLLFDRDQKVIIANEKIRNLYEGMNSPFKRGDTRKDIANSALNWFEEGLQKERIKKFLNVIEKNLVKPRKNIEWQLPNGKQITIDEHYTSDSGIVAIIRDVTKQNLKQQKLEERSRLFKMVFDNVPLGICVYNAEHRVVSWNNKYLEIMDVKPDSIYSGIHMKDLVEANFGAYEDVGENPQEFSETVLNNLHLNLHTKLERQTKSGKSVEIFRNVLPDGGYICTFSDVTMAKSAQLLLQESEVRYRKMVELSPDAILVQKDGMVIYANTAALSLLNIKNLHDLIGAYVRKFFPSDHREKLTSHFGNSDHMSVGDNVPSEISQVIRSDGTRIDVEVEATALLYGDRPVMQLIARDISAQTKTQEFLQKAKEEAEYASQLKGTFLANMSHELRTPLNAVIGFSEIIKNEIFGEVGSDKYIEYANDIHSSGLHLLELINDILDFSKIEANSQELTEEVVDMKQLVSDCIRLVEPQREKSNLSVSIDFPSNLPNVMCDAKILKQVVLNLLSNAIKFTPRSGQIFVRSDLTADGSFYISIEDTGIGIKDEDLIKALTPFVQIDSELSRKYQGTGLGLPLSKNMMELHEGQLTITSIYGEGTNVTITLPNTRIDRSAA